MAQQNQAAPTHATTHSLSMHRSSPLHAVRRARWDAFRTLASLAFYGGYLFDSGSIPQVFLQEGHESRQRKLHLHDCIFNFG
jgi:hypothetical protein